MNALLRGCSACVVVFALAPGAGPSPLVAQEGLTPGDLAITAIASPADVFPGDTVKIRGSTGLTGEDSQVGIRIIPPGGKAAVGLSAKLQASGDYQASFPGALDLGVYAVEVTAPDGKGHASTSFRVVTAGVIPEEVAATADSLVFAAARAVEIATQGVAGLPPSPARDEAEQKLDDLEAELGELPTQVAALHQQMTTVFETRADVPKPIPEWNDYLEGLGAWEADADAARAKLEKLAAPTAAATQGCADLDRYNEMLTFTSEAINFVKAPFELSKGFWVDKIPGGIVARASSADGLSSAEKFALVETMKVAAGALEGPGGIVGAVPGLILDTAQWFLQAGFDKYCEKWEGPISATFIGESFTKQGEPFFDYTIVLDGKLMLLYGKDTPAGQPVKLKGYIEGAGSFDVRDNPKPVARLVPGTVMFHRVTSPPGSGYWDELGQASRGMVPHSFRIPVTGIMAGDSIMLELGPADHDFGPTVNGVSTWVIMPLGGLVPQVINSNIALQKAHPIIDRVLRRHPVLPIARSKDAMVAQGTFARDTTNDTHTARVRTTLTMKACNPGCSPLPLTPGGP